MIILRAVKEYYMVDEIEDAIRLQNIKISKKKCVDWIYN